MHVMHMGGWHAVGYVCVGMRLLGNEKNAIQFVGEDENESEIKMIFYDRAIFI